MIAVSGVFRLLGDDVRLRLLRLLARERLNVSELTAILGVAQSGVSRHLGLLRDAGLLEEQREASFAYYRMRDRAGSPLVDALWPVVQTQLEAADDDVLRADEARLREVVRLRRERRSAHGGGEEPSRQLVPGRSWAAWSRALALLLPPVAVADLGCGDGYLTLEVAAWAKHVVAVEKSASVLARARSLGRRHRIKNIDWKRGDLERLPLDDRSVDVALLSQALHHAVDPERALRESVRIVRPGGRVLVIELAQHTQDWVRERFGDRWLGFDPAALQDMLGRAGLSTITTRTVLDGDPFGVVVAAGTRGRRT